MSTDKQPIPGKSQWPQLTTTQLYEVKGRLTDIYYGALQANASYANQYLKLLGEVDGWIYKKENPPKENQNSGS